MKRINNFIFSIITSFSALLLLNSCANIVSPSGGPKDTTPPQIINCFPSNYSTHFNQKKLEITFDEFIVLKDINSQLIISPPFKEKPEIKIKGKSLVIELNETLKQNTTYTLFFGDAITDLNEGNAIPSYEFVFSTGETLDSMTLTGKVLDAFSQKPEKDIFVMLYNKFYDSIPYKEIPYYMTKTKEDGSFIINNLKDTTFKIFAIKDINNNYIFDQIIEKIAFTDTLVTPHLKPIIPIDTVLKDSLKLAKIPKDTLIADSIKKIELLNKSLSINDLYLFQEVDSTQKIIKAEFKNKREIIVEFRFPVKNLKYNIADNIIDKNLKIDEWNLNRDSLTIWFPKSNIDSINIILNDENYFTDTLHIYQRKNSNPLKINNLTSNLFPVLNYFEKIYLYSAFPLLKYDSIPITLIEETDTNQLYAYAEDYFHKKFKINNLLSQDKSYKLIVKENIVTDILDNPNDSLVYLFKTNTQEDLGNFLLTLKSKDSTNNYIIQLLNEKENIIRQEFVNQNKKISFKNLDPGNYLIKAIKDRNNNQKWDTGDYLKNIQPEETFFYPSKITIRANWDLEEEWIF